MRSLKLYKRPLAAHDERGAGAGKRVQSALPATRSDSMLVVKRMPRQCWTPTQ